MVADKPLTAADYLAQAQQGIQSAPRTAVPAAAPLIPFNRSTQARESKQDPLSWLVDIVTRPLSGITNTVQSNINLGVQQQKALKSGDAGAIAGAAGETALNALFPARHFLSGMFSADPEQHRTTSDVIEQSTDQIGSLDPNYVDVQDNVNPILKGSLGLVGDIAGDPLTWVPGALIVKGAGLLGRGVKGGATAAKSALDALSGATNAEKIAAKTAETVAADGAKTLRPTVEGAAASQATRQVDDAARALDPEAKAIYDDTLDAAKAAPEASKALTDEQLLKVVTDQLEKGATSDAGKALREGLDTLKPLTVQDVKVVPGVTAKSAKPAPFRSKPDEAEGWVEQVAAMDPARLAPKFGDKAQSVVNMAKAALTGNTKALTQLESLHTKLYLPAFRDAKAAGKILGPDFRFINPTRTKTQKVGEATILDSLANYRQQLQTGRDALTARFGPKLTEALARFSSAANFDKSVSRIKAILDRSIDVTKIKKLSVSEAAMLEQIGVSPDLFRDMLRTQAAARKTAFSRRMTYAEQLQKMEGNQSDESIEFATTALKQTIFKDLDRTNLSETHPYETDSGALRTSDEYGAGWGRIHREANNYFQYNLAKSLGNAVSDWIKRTYGKTGRNSVGGVSRAIAFETEFIKALRLSERALDEQGVPLTIGVGAGRQPLSLSQILDVLNAMDEPSTAVTATGVRTSLWAFYNVDTAVPWTNLMDAVEASVKGGPLDEIEAALRQVETRHVDSEGRIKPLPNNMVQGQGRFGRGVTLDSDAMVASLSSLIERSTPMLRAVITQNAEALTTRGIDESLTIAEDVISTLEELRATTGGMGKLLLAINDTKSRVRQIAEDFGMMKSSKELGEAIVEETIPPVDRVIAKGAVNVDDVLRNANAAEEAQQQSAKIAQDTYEGVLKADPIVAESRVVDLGTRNAQQQGRGIAAKVMPIFSRRYGAEGMYPRWMQVENIFRSLVGHYHARLSGLARLGLSNEDLANKLTNARNGVPGNDQVTEELRSLWTQMFGSGDELEQGSLINNAFFRNGNNIHHLNSVFEHNKLDGYLFDLDKAGEVAKAEGISVMAAAARQAREWQITDPLDTLNRMYLSFVTMQSHQTLAQHFLKMAKDLPGTMSKQPRAGFSRIGNESGNSIFAKYLPNDVYFEDNILRQMHVIDNLMQESMDLSGPLGTFIREVFQPLQQAWKYGMTLPNPTHHVRNLVSDYTLTYYALGAKGAKRANVAAFQALAAHNGYDGWDAVKALQEGMEVLPDAGHVVAEGKHGKITADGLYAALNNRGNLLSYKYLEQLNEAVAPGDPIGPLSKVWDKVQNSKGAQFIGGVSEARDHFSRLQHASQFIIQNIDNTKDYKSMEALLDAASDSTRKWHPDGTDMTRIEQYFRLLIPFYSWQRKAIPLIVESMLTHPGRVMTLPKAQYNLAVAMGVNPDSLADPFPQDQLFPSYMTEQITGPIAEIDGKYYGINPGFAANDVLNDWLGADPGRSLLGSVSPLIRAPFEIAAGGQVGTGAKINDYSDYLDSQIPGAAQVSRMTGNSVTGSLVSLLQGDGLDRQYQIDKGNKDPLLGPGLSALNWLTGLGISSMSNPNAINYAEIEKRNAAGDQRGF